MPLSVAWRMRQAVGWAWLAISARWSVVKVTVGSDSWVEMTEKPLVVRRERRRVPKARVRSFSGRLSGRWAPVSGPPWAGSMRMRVRGVGCWATALSQVVRGCEGEACVAICLWGGVKGLFG